MKKILISKFLKKIIKLIFIIMILMIILFFISEYLNFKIKMPFNYVL
jgi:hypothetical protein